VGCRCRPVVVTCPLDDVVEDSEPDRPMRLK
jgi:hypothetical protein